MKLLGNRVIVKDNPLKQENTGIIVKSDTPDLISGVVKYGYDTLKEGATVWYTKHTGSTFNFQGEILRSINNPLETIIFVE